MGGFLEMEKGDEVRSEMGCHDGALSVGATPIAGFMTHRSR